MRLRHAASTIAVVLAGTAFAPHAGAQVQPTAPAGGSGQDSAAGHGSVSVNYTNTFENGIWSKPYRKPIQTRTDRIQGVGVEASYNLADDWTIYGSLRYVKNVGKPDNLPEQHVSSLQDATLGVAWRTHIGDYQITTSATATVPTRDYEVTGGAYAGQHLRQLLLGATLSHQFDFSDIYYRVGYGYAFSQKVRGFDTGYQRFDAELGWFASERFSLRGFLTGRGGFGLTGFEFAQAKAAGKLRDADRARTAEHSYRAWGLGFDYDFGDRYLASLSAQHTYWGATVFDADYALDARLTWNF